MKKERGTGRESIEKEREGGTNGGIGGRGRRGREARGETAGRREKEGWRGRGALSFDSALIQL